MIIFWKKNHITIVVPYGIISKNRLKGLIPSKVESVYCFLCILVRFFSDSIELFRQLLILSKKGKCFFQVPTLTASTGSDVILCNWHSQSCAFSRSFQKIRANKSKNRLTRYVHYQLIISLSIVNRSVKNCYISFVFCFSNVGQIPFVVYVVDTNPMYRIWKEKKTFFSGAKKRRKVNSKLVSIDKHTFDVVGGNIFPLWRVRSVSLQWLALILEWSLSLKMKMFMYWILCIRTDYDSKMENNFLYVIFFHGN